MTIITIFTSRNFINSIMTSEEIIQELETLGQASIKKVLLKHGIKEPLFGVKIEELQKIKKKIKNDYALSLQLYKTGIYDAMYLAGLIAEPGKMTVKDLQEWVKLANAPILYETTVAGIAAESKYGMELAKKWIESKDAGIASAGWATLSHLVSVKEDSHLDIPQLKELLKKVPALITSAPNRVKSTMNSFVISAGSYVQELNVLAKQTAQKMGKVVVDMGDTACKVPDALSYIEKVENKNGVGKKRKSAIC